MKRKRTSRQKVRKRGRRIGRSTTSKRRARMSANAVKKARSVLKKTIKNQIKSVAHCENNMGSFRSEIIGDAVQLINNTNGRDTILFAHSFNSLVDVSPYLPANTSFTPCSIQRILHHASVLYNSKPNDYRITTNDAANFDTKGLKIMSAYCSYKVSLKNMTTIDYEVTVYEFINKRHSDTPVYTTIANLRSQNNYLGGILPTWNTAQTTVDVDLTFEPGELKGLSAHYKLNKRSYVIKVGETVNYFNKKGDQCIDFAKLQKEGGGLAKYVKGDIQVLFRFTPLMSYKGVADSRVPPPDPPDTTFGTGQIVTGPAFQGYGWAVRVKETYVIEQPPETADANEGNWRGFYDGFSSLAPVGNMYFARTVPETTYIAQPVS